MATILLNVAVQIVTTVESNNANPGSATENNSDSPASLNHIIIDKILFGGCVQVSMLGTHLADTPSLLLA